MILNEIWPHFYFYKACGIYGKQKDWLKQTRNKNKNDRTGTQTKNTRWAQESLKIETS